MMGFLDSHGSDGWDLLSLARGLRSQGGRPIHI